MENYFTNKLNRYSKLRASHKKNNYRLILLICIFGFTFSNSFAQNITVTGVVSDESGIPLPGVNVIEKGTSNGASTDFDGNYSIKVLGANAKLVISYLGYVTKEINVAGKKSINVSLEPDTQSLDEVVVIGYGTTKKSDLTGSVVSIGGDDLKEQPIASVAEALTGRLAGVQVISSEGSPDSEINIRIRGGGSITQNSSPYNYC
tara:strand:- start:58670 stop:59281 length:612 start_codon:yes stop_codon:yes gene_type:complete